MALRRRKGVANSLALTKPAKVTQRKPLAAVRERERLRMFNESLESLQNVIPIRLPPGRKLHKKQTLQLASRYIKFLRECLDGNRHWEERRRFWCSNDDDLNIIDAIDAAAATTNPKPTPGPVKKIRKRRDQEPTDEASQPRSSTPPPNVVVVHPPYIREIPEQPREVLRPQFVPQFVPKNVASSVSDAVQYSNALLLAHTGARGGQYGDGGSLPRFTNCHTDRLRNHVRRLDDVWPDLNEIISKNE